MTGPKQDSCPLPEKTEIKRLLSGPISGTAFPLRGMTEENHCLCHGSAASWLFFA